MDNEKKQRNQNGSDLTSQHFEMAHVRSIAKKLRSFIRVCGFILGSWFIYRTFKDLLNSIPIHSLVNTDSAIHIIRLTLVVYFFSWLFGSQDDTRIQENGYLVYKKPKLGFIDYLVMASIAVLFGMMCWKHRNYHALLYVYFIFIIANIAGYKYLIVDTSKHSIDPSLNRLKNEEGDFLLEKKLHIVMEYMQGSWQLWRFAFAILGAVLLNALFNFGVYNSLGLKIPFSQDSISATGFLLLVFILEAWMWIKRRTAISNLEVVEDLHPLKKEYCKKCKEKYLVN